MPTENRETTCFAVREDDVLFIFDAGTGLRRLADPANAALVEGVREIHMFLTHYHLDHVCGLAYLSGVLPGRVVTVHAPDAVFTGTDPEAALSGLLRRPYNPHDWDDLTANLHVRAIGARATIAGHEVQVRRQAHSDASVAYRVDDAFVFATDTRADPATALFAGGCDLLLHEAWYMAADAAGGHLPPGYTSHSKVEDVATLAGDAHVRRLVLIHLNPLRDETYYLRLEAAGRSIFSSTEVLPDGEVLAADADHA
jgi:ribonuclease BN (tRNA processing enzyme)